MKPLRVKRDAPIVTVLVGIAIQALLKLALFVPMALVCFKTACRREVPVLSGANAAAYGVDWSEETTALCDLGGCVYGAIGSIVMLLCRACCRLVISSGPRSGSWSVPTRLETRTKESNMCASIWVANPDA